jgi:hypothetical protein
MTDSVEYLKVCVTQRLRNIAVAAKGFRRSGLTCTPLADRLPSVLFLRHWTLLPKGIHHSFLLVVDPTEFQASPESLILCYGVHHRGVRCIYIDRHAIHETNIR